MRRYGSEYDWREEAYYCVPRRERTSINVYCNARRDHLKTSAYNTEEGCFTLFGGPRPCKLYKSIKVKYQNLELQTRIKTYTGWMAQIIQHEVDHCDWMLV